MVGCTPAGQPNNRHSEVMSEDIEQKLRAKLRERDEAYAKARAASHELWEMAEQSNLGASAIARILGVSRGAIYSWRRQKNSPVRK